MLLEAEGWVMSESDEPIFTVVPAAPGYILHYIMSDEPEIQKPGETVVAWVVSYINPVNSPGDLVTDAMPVTAGGATHKQGYVIEQPDGTIVFPDNMVLESFEAALKHFAEYRKAR